jgi:hypothetical protein
LVEKTLYGCKHIIPILVELHPKKRNVILALVLTAEFPTLQCALNIIFVESLLADAVYVQKFFFCPWHSDAYFLQRFISEDEKFTRSVVSQCLHSSSYNMELT